MWVKGDLKKQLGIKSRHAKKNDKQDMDLENFPIYRPDHERSVSETSQHQAGGYVPALTDSPGNRYEESPEKVNAYTPGPQNWQDGSSTGHVGLQYIVEGDPDDSQATIAGPAASHTIPPVSPSPSYYSASDIPVPTPNPSPQYAQFGHDRGPSSSSSSPRELAVPPDYGPPYSFPHRSNLLQPPPPQREASSSTSSSSSSHGHPSLGPQHQVDSYELQVRSPPSSFPPRMQASSPFPSRGASRASEISYYATASEKWDGESEDEDSSTINHGNGQPSSSTHHGRRDSSYSGGPHAI